MRVLIVSDTHGFAEQLELLLPQVGKIDALIHAGDVDGQERYIRNLVDCPCYMVAGNNDWDTDLPSERIIDILDYRIFLTHGHRYGVSLGTERLEDEARSRKVQIAVFGHTHKPMVRKINNLYLVNPGSLAFPRQIGRKPTYVLMNINQDHEISFTINQLNRKRR